MQTKLNLTPVHTEKFLDKYCAVNGVFTEDELKEIETYCASYGTGNSYVVGHDGLPITNSTVRVSNTKMHHPNQKNQWFFDKLLYISEQANNNFFNFNLSGFEYFQYTEYNGSGSNYDWHMDMVFGNALPKSMDLMRKLSVSLILSNESEYKGGDFEIMTAGQSVEQIEQKRGSLIFFPSFVLHRVSPLTEGQRRSIVYWILGPKFK
jgi:PKHD-type hydroxylase